jgi:hypothetical protein
VVLLGHGNAAWGDATAVYRRVESGAGMVMCGSASARLGSVTHRQRGVKWSPALAVSGVARVKHGQSGVMLSKGRAEYSRVEQWQRKALSGVGEVLCGGAVAEWCHVA